MRPPKPFIWPPKLAADLITHSNRSGDQATGDQATEEESRNNGTCPSQLHRAGGPREVAPDLELRRFVTIATDLVRSVVKSPLTIGDSLDTPEMGVYTNALWHKRIRRRRHARGSGGGSRSSRFCWDTPIWRAAGRRSHRSCS